jgi:hypothetical protein
MGRESNKFLWRLHREVVEKSHSPYSPDLVPAHHFRFHEIKTAAKVILFKYVEDTNKNVRAELTAVTPKIFDEFFFATLTDVKIVF